MTMRRTALALAALVLAPLTACGDTQPGHTDLTVLAAASLTDVFKQLGEAYEQDHPDSSIRFSFAGSQEVAAQVRQGAPADAVVTADTETMDDIRPDTNTPVTIATNRLTIATAPGNPKKITDIADLARPDLRTVLAAPEVPVGHYSREVLDRQSVTVTPVSQEPSVRAVLSKVELGEADAGLVYVTDTTAAAKRVDTVDIPASQNITATYPAATLTSSSHPDEAAEFIDWLRSDQATRVLRAAGFQQP